MIRISWWCPFFALVLNLVLIQSVSASTLAAAKAIACAAAIGGGPLITLDQAVAPSKILEQHATDIVLNLKKNGVHQIHDLSLDTLLTQIKAVRWIDKPDAEMPEFVGTRRSAVCQKGRNEVHVKSLPTQYEREEMATFALHEALCAIGYRDERYEMSVTLNEYLTLPASMREMGIMFKNLNPGEQLWDWGVQIAGGKGGVSSVGGGGDIVAARIKLGVLRFLAAHGMLDDSIAWKLMNSTNLEPQNAGLPMAFNIQPFANAQFMTLILNIWIPMERWEKAQSPKDREQLLGEISAFVISTFVNERDRAPVVLKCPDLYPPTFFIRLPSYLIPAVKNIVPDIKNRFYQQCEKAKRLRAELGLRVQ